MSSVRLCSRARCAEPAIATMTFDYRAAIGVIGPLSPEPSVGGIDLCSQHVQSATVPVGWQMVRLQAQYERTARDVDEAIRNDGLTDLADVLEEAEKNAQQPDSSARDLNVRAGITINAEGTSPGTGDLPNPWEVHTESIRTPRLRIIDGGAEDTHVSA